MNKLFAYLIIGIFFLTFVSSVKLGDDYLLDQTCNNCTYCNISSITYPNSSFVLQNANMTKDGTYYSYNLDGGNTTVLGTFNWCYDCGNDVEKATGCFNFEVTPNGEEISTGESILYIFITLMFFSLIVLLFYFIIIMPKGNEKSETGEVLRIVRWKYIRIFFIALMYPMIIVLLNILNGLAVNFSTLSMFSGIIGFFFNTMLRLAWVFTVIICLWIIYKLIQDSNISKNIKSINRIRV